MYSHRESLTGSALHKLRGLHVPTELYSGIDTLHEDVWKLFTSPGTPLDVMSDVRFGDAADGQGT